MQKRKMINDLDCCSLLICGINPKRHLRRTLLCSVVPVCLRNVHMLVAMLFQKFEYCKRWHVDCVVVGAPVGEAVDCRPLTCIAWLGGEASLVCCLRSRRPLRIMWPWQRTFCHQHRLKLSFKNSDCVIFGIIINVRQLLKKISRQTSLDSAVYEDVIHVAISMVQRQRPRERRLFPRIYDHLFTQTSCGFSQKHILCHYTTAVPLHRIGQKARQFL